ncbi:5663_t:CDS:2, partial [Ambispora leptoticha]
VRKLCRQISARIACFQYEKHAQFDARHQPNFGRFLDMEDWFVERDIEKIKKDAYEWKLCNTEDQRKKHLSEKLERDFLDIQQTKSDQHILANFVKACNLLVCRILDKESLNEAHQRLLNVAKLIEHHYGPEKITPNIHLSLHLCENCMDYGPLYSFWCFSFERMNGILEPELLRIILTNNSLDEVVSNAEKNVRLSDSLIILKGRISGDSIDISDEFETQDLLQFYKLRNIIDQGESFSYELFHGIFLGPKSENAILQNNILDLLVEFYNNGVTGYQFTTPGDILRIDQISVFPKIIQYEQLKLGSEIFGSTFSARHIKFSRILARFVAQEDESVDLYPGQVQFYFDHTIHLPSGELTYHLAFVRWYKPVENYETRFQ